MVTRYVTVDLGEVTGPEFFDRHYHLVRAVEELGDGYRQRHGVRCHGGAVFVMVRGHQADEVVDRIKGVAEELGVIEVRETLW